MISMTGYGYKAVKGEDYSLEIEIKSYNNRYLDLQSNISYALSPLENAIAERVKEKVRRGHLDLSVRFKAEKTRPTISVDEGALEAYRKAFERIGELTGLKPSFSDYASIEDILVSVKENDAELYRDAVLSTLDEALEALLAEKRREGENTRMDLSEKIDAFSSSLEEIKANSDRMSIYFKNVLETRYQELMEEKGLSDSRFMEEVTLLLVKYSINEEIKRLESHIAEFRRLIASDEAVGKRLDFLSQEMNRECNTIGSKSQMVEITRCVVVMKDSIENIREQIRNIE